MHVQDVVQFPEGVGREPVARLVHQGQLVDVKLKLGATPKLPDGLEDVWVAA
jgi:hypothetical protein